MMAEMNVDGPAEAVRLRAAPGGIDQRRDDVVGECLDERAECEGDNQAHGNDDEVALHQEVLETLKHLYRSLS
jgi:hypothetical protein